MSLYAALGVQSNLGLKGNDLDHCRSASLRASWVCEYGEAFVILPRLLHVLLPGVTGILVHRAPLFEHRTPDIPGQEI